VVESTGLENQQGFIALLGFKSLSHRQILNNRYFNKSRFFFVLRKRVYSIKPSEFIKPLQTLVDETGRILRDNKRGAIKGKMANILARLHISDESWLTLITYWETLECIKSFAGENIDIAKLYPEDEQYQLNPDGHVIHYKVRENSWL
jgi:hypothetical protein